MGYPPCTFVPVSDDVSQTVVAYRLYGVGSYGVNSYGQNFFYQVLGETQWIDIYTP